jgi:hypothetical protein
MNDFFRPPSFTWSDPGSVTDDADHEANLAADHAAHHVDEEDHPGPTTKINHPYINGA